MEYLNSAKEKFNALIEKFKDELTAIRTNRPSAKLIEDVRVNYMDQNMSVKQVGSISIEQPRDLLVSVWDENAIKSVAGGLEAANLGFGVSVQGKVIRVSLPELTGERKEELIKVVKSTAEDTRIKMRTLRDEFNKITKSLKDEDDKFRGKEELQKIVDQFNETIDQLVESKSREILE